MLRQGCPDGRLLLLAVPMWFFPLIRRFPRLLFCLGLRKMPRNIYLNIYNSIFCSKNQGDYSKIYVQIWSFLVTLRCYISLKRNKKNFVEFSTYIFA